MTHEELGDVLLEDMTNAAIIAYEKRAGYELTEYQRCMVSIILQRFLDIEKLP